VFRQQHLAEAPDPFARFVRRDRGSVITPLSFSATSSSISWVLVKEGGGTSCPLWAAFRFLANSGT